ncbi:polysaccharide deacetylase family protein [Candidatus Sumerlaeota bacterium]|nr:polysaccharide deacetylase family protein [Candidatus Sumerlaeota bacterium]
MTNVCVVMYHGIDSSGSVVSTAPELFERQIMTWKSQGIRFLCLSEFLAFVHGEQRVEQNAILLTFDDGLRSVYQNAFPLLRREGIPAIVFLVSEFMGKTNQWPGQPSFVPSLPIMTWEEAREMHHAGIEFGAHTATHPRLAECDEITVERELHDCTTAMQQALTSSKRVRSVAYPYGSVSPHVEEAARAKFVVGFGTRVGKVRAKSNLMNIPRVDAYDLRVEPVYTRLFTPGGNAYLSLRGMIRSGKSRIRGT